MNIAQKYVNFTTNTGMGGTIIEFFQQFLPRWGMSIEIAATQAIFDSAHNSGIPWLEWIHVPIWITVLWVVGKYYGWMLANYLVGRYMHRSGMWKKISEEQQKRDHINPLPIENRDTLIAICKKLGIEHKFKDLNV